MKTKLLLCFAFIALSLASCSDDDSSPTPQQGTDIDDFEPVSINPELVAEGNMGESETLAQQKMVITEEPDWQTLITQMAPYSSTFADSNIDFSTRRVLAVFTPIEEYNASISIDSIVEHQDNIKVFVGDPVGGILPTLSVGYSIVKIPTSEKPIVFE